MTNTEKCAKEYRVYWTNHAYYAHECFETAEKAIEYGKSKCFDFSVQEIGRGLNPYTFQTTQIATWSVFGGLRRRAA